MRVTRAARALALVLFSTLVEGCASSSRARKAAFVDAGAIVRRRETGHTYEEVRRDLSLFIARDVVSVRERALERARRIVVLDRWGFALGTGLATLGATAGSLEGSARGAFEALGIGLAVGTLADYLERVGGMKECQAFLDRAEEDLGSFAKRGLGASEGPAPQGLWEDYVDKTAEIQRYPKCLPVR